MPLDPHVRRVVDMLALARGSAPSDLRQRRAAFRGLMRLSETGARVAHVEDRVVPGLAGTLTLRLYTPPDAPDDALPGLVYLHGGGFMCGDLDSYDALCRTLSEETGCRLIAVDYRLAPEHRFPAAVEDACAATLWVIDHAGALGLDPARIAIAGDSAGATLATAACQAMARSRPGALALQVLLCPILDWTAEARRDFAEGHLLDAETMAHELACYLPAGHTAGHPQVSPLRGDLRGQPEAQIHTAEFDPVRDDGRRYTEKLQLAGVAARQTCHEGMTHLFYALGRAVPYARRAHRQIGADVRAALAHGVFSHV